jgi:prepilin-type processing-associated H-X9-DG protein
MRYTLTYKRFSDLRAPSPAQAWVIIDIHPDCVVDGFFDLRPDTNEPAYWRAVPASYHDGGCTMVFADAHAQFKKWLVPQTQQPVLYTIWDRTIENPIFDRRDYDWLCARMVEYHSGLRYSGVP